MGFKPRTSVKKARGKNRVDLVDQGHFSNVSSRLLSQEGQDSTKHLLPAASANSVPLPGDLTFDCCHRLEHNNHRCPPFDERTPVACALAGLRPAEPLALVAVDAELDAPSLVAAAHRVVHRCHLPRHALGHSDSRCPPISRQTVRVSPHTRPTPAVLTLSSVGKGSTRSSLRSESTSNRRRRRSSCARRLSACSERSWNGCGRARSATCSGAVR